VLRNWLVRLVAMTTWQTPSSGAMRSLPITTWDESRSLLRSPAGRMGGWADGRQVPDAQQVPHGSGHLLRNAQCPDCATRVRNWD